MIIKNIIGVILVIFSILIIFSFFNSISENSILISQRNSFEKIINNLEFLCSNHKNNFGNNLEFKDLGGDFIFYKNSNNSVCFKFSDNEINCMKFNCLINSDKILINGSMEGKMDKEKDKLKFYSCFFEKMSFNEINISCRVEYNY